MKTLAMIALLASTLIASTQYQDQTPGGPEGRRPYRTRPLTPRTHEDVLPGQVYPPPAVEDVVPGRAQTEPPATSTAPAAGLPSGVDAAKRPRSGAEQPPPGTTAPIAP